MAITESNAYFATPAQMRRYQILKVLRYILVYGFLTLVGIFIVIPFIFMLVTAFREPTAYNRDTTFKIFNLFPAFWNDYTGMSNYTLDNFVTIFTYKSAGGTSINFGLYYANTIIVAGISTIFTVATSVLAAFAFARCDFKGKNALFALLLATMMVPGEMMVITN